jgi:hypothetical protein
MDEQLFILAKSILESRGHNENWNLIRVARVYRDDKISIEGVLDNDGESLDALYIALYLPPEEIAKPPMEPRFALARTTPPEETLVYQWREATHYFRPGRWVIYLQQLYAEVFQQYERAQKLNGEPVDDASVFPKIELPTPPAEAKAVAKSKSKKRK